VKLAKPLLLTVVALLPLYAAEVRTLKDVVYGHASGQDLTMDAYLCAAAKPAPVLVFIHGGGWMGGDKAGVPDFLKGPMQDAGISLVSVNYRLSKVAIYPAQVDDVTRAVQFVRFKAKEWQIDPRRVAVMGPSAGGHLSLWVGLHPERANPKSSDPVERESSRVLAIVNYFGPADFHLVRQHAEKYKHPAYRLLFGYAAEDPLSKLTEAQMQAASPISYITASEPPVFTAHGTGDTTVDEEQAESLIAKLKAKGVVTENYILSGGNHGLSNPQPDWPDFRKATIEFLKRHLLN
jgi:acetyl esterase/lipase